MPHQKVAFTGMLLFALALLGFVHAAPAIDSIPFAMAAALPTASSKLYLPIVRQSPPVPRLLAPANGSNASLAPVLSWSLPVTVAICLNKPPSSGAWVCFLTELSLIRQSGRSQPLLRLAWYCQLNLKLSGHNRLQIPLHSVGSQCQMRFITG